MHFRFETAKLKNDTLKDWVNQELNGYPDSDNLPDYRKSTGVAKGLFVGGWGSLINDQPLSPTILKEEHRHFARDIILGQPIASYENVDGIKNAVIPWPAALTAMYQSEFMNGYVLNRAWMEIPGSLMKGLVDTVRTRLLNFALEIQSELPSEDESAVDIIPSATVERIIQVTINGGTNIVGDGAQLQSITINKGDMDALKKELSNIGVEQSDIAALEHTLTSESAEDIKPKTLDWITSTAKKVGASSLKIAEKTVEEVIKSALKSYLGL